MLKKTALMAALAFGSLSMSVPAAAQLTQTGGLVNVTITDISILNNFLNDTQVAALNNVAVPVTVAVPVGVAANVCPNVAANVLAAAAQKGTASCTATNGSRALAQSVVRQKGSQTK